jgi:hypothetical protein
MIRKSGVDGGGGGGGEGLTLVNYTIIYIVL